MLAGMDDLTSTPAVGERLRSLARWLDATPTELLGLATLLAGAVLATVLLWWQGQPRPATPPPNPGAAAPTPLSGSSDAASAAPASGPSEGPTEVAVHVTGAVTAPGVLHLPAGARVADAVAAAGGATVVADPGLLNLAREVRDGEQVVVPELGDPAPAQTAGDGSTAGAGGASGPVDLNQATAEQLEALPGIGPVLAGRILEFREANGGFTEVGQLREVPGIGEKRFQELAEQVRV